MVGCVIERESVIEPHAPKEVKMVICHLEWHKKTPPSEKKKRGI